MQEIEVTRFNWLGHNHLVKLPPNFDPEKHRVIMEEKSATRKYEEEYTLYLAYVKACGPQFKPMEYTGWFRQWEEMNEKRQQTVLKEYSLRSQALSSLQERDVVASALCFDLYVSPRT